MNILEPICLYESKLILNKETKKQKTENIGHEIKV